MSVKCFLLTPVTETEWRMPDGSLTTLADAPAGAMWDATWYPDSYKGADGCCMIVRLPNGFDWVIDSRANNCDQPERVHKCWIRHGEPPMLTVDKNGDTCGAGAGSILSRAGTPSEWHGFLRNGELTL